MAKATQDNEPLSFITLAASTANVIRYLTEKQNPSDREERPAGNEGQKTPENRPNNHREYVDQRLRELAAWERRIGGKK